MTEGWITREVLDGSPEDFDRIVRFWTFSNKAGPHRRYLIFSRASMEDFSSMVFANAAKNLMRISLKMSMTTFVYNQCLWTYSRWYWRMKCSSSADIRLGLKCDNDFADVLHDHSFDIVDNREIWDLVHRCQNARHSLFVKGIFCGGMRLQDVGDRFSLTRQRVKQVEDKFIEKAREIAERHGVFEPGTRHGFREDYRLKSMEK